MYVDLFLVAICVRSNRMEGLGKVQGGISVWMGCNGFDRKGFLSDCSNLN